MFVWQLMEPNPAFMLLCAVSEEDAQERDRELKKIINKSAFKVAHIKQILEWMFSYVPESFAAKWREVLLNNCDLSIAQSYSMHGLSQLDFQFIFKTKDAKAFSFVKSNWHIAWEELFPDKQLVYEEDQIEEAKSYVETNNQAETGIHKDTLIQNYLEKHYTAKPATDLSRSRFNPNWGLPGVWESIRFCEDEEEENRSSEEDESWTQLLRNYHAEFKHPYYSVDLKNGKLKLRKMKL